MKYKFDLHLHSTLSDGDYKIEEVIRQAKKSGLKTISITDHNTWDYFGKKIMLVKKYGIINIPGIEISTKLWGIEIHILGYSKKFKTDILKAGLKTTIDGYNKRAKIIINKLAAKKIVNVNYQTIKNQKGKNIIITKYDIAKEIAKKLNINVLEALKFVNHGGPAYVPYGSWAMTPMQAIKLIRQADGKSFLAHPGETFAKLTKKFGKDIGEKKFNSLIYLLLKNNLDGMEAYSPKNNPKTLQQCLKIANKHKLLISGGSDWHGEKHHPELKMGSSGLTEKLYQKFIKNF